ncbi:MAG: diadenylate cyclase CdaA [Prevotella sp.]|nr:diadenylate cyclase CdaA [Prevotella sp.]
MFLSFGIKDAVDIVLVALLLYYAWRLMRESRSIYVFNGIVLFVLLWLLVSQVFEMKLLGNIMSQLINVGVIGLIVLFAEEIRKFLYNLGANQRTRRFLQRFGIIHDTKRADLQTMMPVVMACNNMARSKTGALIVVERGITLDDIVSTGDEIDAAINQRLIENIFFKNSPLHDGAMIISGKRIKAAGCILPVSHDYRIPKEFGLRHRAAMGISEQTDAIAIAVSEETGRITVAKDGQFKVRVSAEELESILTGI